MIFGFRCPIRSGMTDDRDDWWAVMFGCFVIPGSDRTSLTTAPV